MATRSRTRKSSISQASTPLSANSTSSSKAPSTSSSSTSLSSMGLVNEKSRKPLLDTYGNEFELPDFTIKQIRDAIPAHCYKSSTLRSLSYVARDLVLVSSNFYAFKFHIIPALAECHPAARFAAWGVYSFLQGLFATGLWVLAHECGHGAFSPSKTVNDLVGWVLHSSLLVPFWSWKISHGKHHKATGHLERDMVFVPKSREEYSRRYAGGIGHDIVELTEETPIATLVHLIGQQLLGWPLYLINNVTGHSCHERQSEGRGIGKRNGWFGGVNHFDPRSPLYESRDAKWILLSDVGIAVAMYFLYQAVQIWGLANVAIWYIGPYLWVNHWLGKFLSLHHWICLSVSGGYDRLTNVNHQWPSHSSSTLTPLFLTTTLNPGPTLVEPQQLLIAILASSVVISSTVSSRPTLPTTSFPAFPSTRPTRPLRLSRRLWASTTDPTPKVAQLDSSVLSGDPLVGANLLSLARALRVKERESSFSGTEMVLVFHLPVRRRLFLESFLRRRALLFKSRRSATRSKYVMPFSFFHRLSL